MLAYGLARNCKITVESIIIALIQIVKRKGIGGVMRCAHGFLHYNSTNTESFQHQSWFELKRRKIDSSLPKEKKGLSYYFLSF